MRCNIYFVDGSPDVVKDSDCAGFGAFSVVQVGVGGYGVWEDGEKIVEADGWLGRDREQGVGCGGAAGLLPKGKGQADVVNAGAVVALAYGGVFLIDPFQSVLTGCDEPGMALPAAVATPVAPFATVDIEVEPVFLFAGDVVVERKGVVEEDIDIECEDGLQVVVDGSGTDTIAAVVGQEGVDLPGIEIGMLPRQVCEIG